MPDPSDIRSQLDDVRDHRDRVYAELSHISAREQAEGLCHGLAERRANLNTAIERLVVEVGQHQP
jgi:hypothetical protein